MAILGRTDLSRGVSGAKFDAQADFEVRLAVDPRERHEKLIFSPKNFIGYFFSASIFFSIGNRSKRGLAKFHESKNFEKTSQERWKTSKNNDRRLNMYW